MTGGYQDHHRSKVVHGCAGLPDFVRDQRLLRPAVGIEFGSVAHTHFKSALAETVYERGISTRAGQVQPNMGHFMQQGEPEVVYPVVTLRHSNDWLGFEERSPS